MLLEYLRYIYIVLLHAVHNGDFRSQGTCPGNIFIEYMRCVRELNLCLGGVEQVWGLAIVTLIGSVVKMIEDQRLLCVFGRKFGVMEKQETDSCV